MQRRISRFRGLGTPWWRRLPCRHVSGSALGTPDFSPACLSFIPGERYPLPIFPLCSLRLPLEPCFQDKYKSVSRRREKKGRLRRDAALGNAPSEKIKRCQTKVWRSQRVHKNLFSVFSVPSVRTLFFKTCTKAYRAVARRRGAYAAMLVLSVFSVRKPCFSFKTCQLESWRSQAFSGRSQAYRAVAKRRGAYAAMLRLRTFPRCSQSVLGTFTSVSRRREKKWRLRRDAALGNATKAFPDVPSEHSGTPRDLKSSSLV